MFFGVLSFFGFASPRVFVDLISASDPAAGWSLIDFFIWLLFWFKVFFDSGWFRMNPGLVGRRGGHNRDHQGPRPKGFQLWRTLVLPRQCSPV